MLRLRKNGKTNAAIAREVNLPNPSLNSGLVVPIIKFLLMDEANDVLESYKNNKSSKNSSGRTKICLVCGNEFTQEKGKTQKYCRECNKKYDTFQKRVIIGIKEGKYDKNLAIKIKKMLDEGFSKASIARKYNIPNPSLINTIIDYLYYDNFNPNSLKGPGNTSFINENDLESLDLNGYLIKTESENKFNLLVKGPIPSENCNTLFSFLSYDGVSVKNMHLRENDDETCEVDIDLDGEEKYVDDLIFIFKLFGLKC